MKCEHCDSKIEGSGKKYCSLLCANRAIGIKSRGRTPHIKNCLYCESEFSTQDNRKRFCNRSCSASFNNEGKRRHGVAPKRCKGCPTLIRDRVKCGYCSTKCRQDHEIVLWLNGHLDGSWKYTHAAYVRRFLDNRSAGMCEMSGCSENRTRKDGSSILQVDHIDGNWRNNRPENLRLICPSCHALTDNWGAGNMGNGRKWKADYSQF